MNIVIFASRQNNPYNTELTNNIKKYCLDNSENIEVIEITKDILRREINSKPLIRLLKKVIKKYENRIFIKFLDILKTKQMKEIASKEVFMKADIINVHYIDDFFKYTLLKYILKNNDRVKIISTIWGSDFFRVKKENLSNIKYILNRSKIIIFNNEEAAKIFDQYYDHEFKERIRIARFGLKVLEDIDYIKKRMGKEQLREDFEIKNRYIICVGTNSRKEQQHIKVIKEICNLPESLLKNIKFIFPMSYGNTKNKNIVSKLLSETILDYLVLDEWVSFEKLAKIRIISDILVQVQTSDQFSGAMQETMFAGNYVLTGSWLPYFVLKEKGLYFEEIDSIEDINLMISSIIKNMKSKDIRLQKNAEIIWELSSWNNTIGNWINIYKSVI